MGPLGKELTEAWAIAILMGKTQDVELPIFEAIRNKGLNNVDDIKKIFAQASIDEKTYELTRQSIAVKGFVAKQNSAVMDFDVKGTPTFYVNGYYKINNAGIVASTAEEYVEEFADVVQSLLGHDSN